MISKNTLKLYTQLQQNKYRKLQQLFIAEGIKTVSDLYNSNYECIRILISNKFNEKEFLSFEPQFVEDVAFEDIKRISSFKNPQPVLGIFKIPELSFEQEKVESGLTILLEDIQDPGNLGTIIRIANWYGIENIICTPNSVDIYNPKVVQASMGSLTKVNVFYEPLQPIVLSTKLPVYGTFMNGTNIYEGNLNEKSFILLGNEGKGISEELEKLVTNRITVPSFSTTKNTTDSLNISVAAGIICSEFKRSVYSK